MNKSKTYLNEDYDVVVVGGGPAGLMAAGIAAGSGARVLIVEKNGELGKKLSITGGGRCNITNAETDIHKFLQNYGDAKKFLYSPFSKFGVTDTFIFFDKLGLPLVVEARKRAFPKTQNAKDVTRAMINFAKKNNVEFRLNTVLKRFLMESQADAQDKIIAIETNSGKIYAKHFVMATGGVSAPETGSDGSGFQVLKNAGYTIHKPTPNLVPLSSNAKWVRRLAGVSPSFMTARFKQYGRTHFKKTGKILFTHFGLSGPLIINSSSHVADMLKNGPVTVSIDLFPDTDHAMLDKRLVKLLDKHKNKLLKNILPELVGKKLSDELIFLSGLQQEIFAHSLTKEARKKLIHIMKDLQVPISGTMGMDRAIIADGGVDLSEIDFKTMQSKLHPNMHIVGDMLHINRPSGGYSLQLCWTTGFVAGKHIADKYEGGWLSIS